MTDARPFFDAIARRYDRVYALDSRASRTRMTRVLRELAPRSNVLDLGVGTGRELSSLQDAGHAPTGLDFSREMLAICARRARPVPLVTADFWEPLPFADASFHAVLALHGTLAHAPNEGALAQLGAEIARVLVGGGVFVAELPSHAWLTRLAAGALASDDRSARASAGDRCVYEDLVAGVTIEAWVPEDARWCALLAATGALDARAEALGDDEMLLVARHARAIKAL